jgi:sporulation protein YlmC with PRC-barrel domain
VSSTLKSCLKRDVVTIAEGRNLGRPTDIFIDPEEHAASLVVLARGNVPDSTLFVAASVVRSFDTDTLAIDSLDSLQIAATDDDALALLEKGLRFRGHPLIDSQGRKLGKIVNIRIDERGKVVQYVARRGLLGWVKPRIKIEPNQLGTAGGEMGVVREIKEPPPPPLSLPSGNTTPEQATDE